MEQFFSSGRKLSCQIYYVLASKLYLLLKDRETPDGYHICAVSPGITLLPSEQKWHRIFLRENVTTCSPRGGNASQKHTMLNDLNQPSKRKNTHSIVLLHGGLFFHYLRKQAVFSVERKEGRNSLRRDVSRISAWERSALSASNTSQEVVSFNLQIYNHFLLIPEKNRYKEYNITEEEVL